MFSIRRVSYYCPLHIETAFSDFEKVRETNSPAIPLLFASMPRAILRYAYRYMQSIIAESTQHSNDPSLGRLYQEFGMMLTGNLVKIDQIDKVLSQIDSSIKSAYQSSSISEVDRRAAETNMLVNAELPQVLMSPLKHLLTSMAETLKEEINVAELYFTDHSWLGLDGKVGHKQRNSKQSFDTMRKVQLRKNARLRRCTRCCAITENGTPNTIPQHMVNGLMRWCLCGSYWMILDESENSLEI